MPLCRSGFDKSITELGGEGVTLGRDLKGLKH